jgi:hypothetical protein
MMKHANENYRLTADLLKKKKRKRKRKRDDPTFSFFLKISSTTEI